MAACNIHCGSTVLQPLLRVNFFVEQVGISVMQAHNDYLYYMAELFFISLLLVHSFFALLQNILLAKLSK
jgi:hypothetical protein